MIVKIVGFKVDRDKSTCYYKIDIPEKGSLDYGVRKGNLSEKAFDEILDEMLGHKLMLALKKSDFVSVRK